MGRYREILDRGHGGREPNFQELAEVVWIHLDRASTLKQTAANVGDMAKSTEASIGEFERLVKTELAGIQGRLSDARES